MKKRLIKSIIKSLSFTSLFISGITFSLATLLSVKFLLDDKGKDAYAIYVEPYKYVEDIYLQEGYTKEEIIQMLRETWLKSGWKYQTRLGFTEKERTGKYVNVSSKGFRLNGLNDPKNDLLKNKSNENFPNQNLIYFFGGSTSFGYGVRDNETIPAQLEKELLNSDVVNFGRGYYYSSQENDLLEELLKFKASKPDLIIFLDGVNERCNLEQYQNQMSELFDKASYLGFKWYPEEYAKPILKALSIVSSKYKKYISNKSGIKYLNKDCQSPFKKTLLSNVFEFNLKKRKAICDLYTIKCLTFFQPLVGFHNIHYHADKHNVINSKLKYEELNKGIKQSGLEVIDITKVLNKLEKHAFIDDIHYSPEANGIIAKEIKNQINLRFIEENF